MLRTTNLCPIHFRSFFTMKFIYLCLLSVFIISSTGCLKEGCTDPTAVNYDPSATSDDGSCSFAGCTDMSACNYDPNALNNDGSCVFPPCDGTSSTRPFSLCDDVTSPLTLSNDPDAEVDYVINCWLDIYADVTVEPGTVITFAQDAGIAVWEGGSLQAVGTPDAIIEFRGQESIKGFWAAIRFGSNTVKNELNYVLVRDGGSASYYSSEPDAQIFLPDDSRLNLSNSTIDNGNLYGFSAYEQASFVYSNNTINNHNSFPVAISAAVVGMIDGTSSSYAGNVNNAIYVWEDDVTNDQTWPAQQIPYQLEGKWVNVNAALTLAPGVTIQFEEGGGMAIWDDASINAVGNMQSPIIIRGVEPLPGYWAGIRMESNSLNNVFDFVEVSDGGSESYYFSEPDALIFITNGRLAISNSSFNNSLNHGLATYDDGVVSAFANNTFNGNQANPIYTFASRIGDYTNASPSTFTANADNTIRVKKNSVDVNQTWYDAGIPYKVESGWVSIDAAVTIQAGTEFVFEEDCGMAIWNTGSLNANGTASNVITFTGVQAVAGYWNGLRFDSTSPNNVLNNCVVSYAGRASYYFSEPDANVFAHAGLLSVTNSTISHSLHCGLAIDNGASVDYSDLNFTNNVDGNVCF